MTTSTRYALVRASESRLGLLHRPWISPQPPTPPARAARWGSILASLLVTLTLAATLYAGGK